MPEHIQYEDDDLFNPETHHEHSDVPVRPLFWFIVIFIVFAVASHVALYFLYKGFVSAERRRMDPPQTQVARPDDAAVPQNQPLLQPFPRADVPPQRQTPVTDLLDMRRAEDERLRHYGWVDKQHGVVHIPIEEAKRAFAARAAVASQFGAPAGRRRSTVLALLLAALPLFAQQQPPQASIAQKLNTQIPLDLQFRNERGEVVRLKQYFNHGRPVLLHFVYFRCPMLCPMVLEGTTTSLTQLKFDIGREFDVLTVSIDPRDTAKLAAEKKDKYVRHYGRLQAANGWHFLTAHETAIKQLADAVGFQYTYDSRTDQFAHGAALLVLTPDGRTSRYFYGFEYKPRDLRLAIVEASEGKIGTAADQLLLLCFHYDPATGKYSRNAMMFARAGGVTTLLALGGFIFVMFRKERKSPPVLPSRADGEGRPAETQRPRLTQGVLRRATPAQDDSVVSDRKHE